MLTKNVFMHIDQINSMHKYNPNKHNRRSIRLKGYDYSQPGLYFITICVQDRDCLFGYIENKIMNLNDAGKMVEKWYYELENKFPEIKCHQMIVMPDHFHCILQIVDVGADIFQIVGADTQVCPDDDDININADIMELSNGIPVGADLCVCPDMCVCPSLHRVVQWFKTMTTNEYIRGVKTKKWQSFRGKLWQRNYYEHIIRNKRSYQNISAYILKNPAKWTENRI